MAIDFTQIAITLLQGSTLTIRNGKIDSWDFNGHNLRAPAAAPAAPTRVQAPAQAAPAPAQAAPAPAVPGLDVVAIANAISVLVQAFRQP